MQLKVHTFLALPTWSLTSLLHSRCFLSPFATIVCGHPSGAPASRPRTDKTLRALHEPRFVPGEFPTPHEPARSTSHVSTSSIHAA